MNIGQVERIEATVKKADVDHVIKSVRLYEETTERKITDMELDLLCNRHIRR